MAATVCHTTEYAYVFANLRRERQLYENIFIVPQFNTTRYTHNNDRRVVMAFEIDELDTPKTADSAPRLVANWNKCLGEIRRMYPEGRVHVTTEYFPQENHFQVVAYPVEKIEENTTAT